MALLVSSFCFVFHYHCVKSARLKFVFFTFLAADDMKRVADEFGISVYKLRAKINNERTKWDRVVAKRGNQLKM